MPWGVYPIVHKPDWLIEAEKKEEERLASLSKKELLIELIKELRKKSEPNW